VPVVGGTGRPVQRPGRGHRMFTDGTCGHEQICYAIDPKSMVDCRSGGPVWRAQKNVAATGHQGSRGRVYQGTGAQVPHAQKRGDAEGVDNSSTEYTHERAPSGGACVRAASTFHFRNRYRPAGCAGRVIHAYVRQGDRPLACDDPNGPVKSIGTGRSSPCRPVIRAFVRRRVSRNRAKHRWDQRL